jgi:hypothetical protein
MMSKIIKNYLDQRAKEDEQFAKSYAKEHKSLDECLKYISQQARKRAENNVAMIEDAEVYGWAVHYYDEDDIKVEGSAPQAQVAISAPSVPTPAPTAKQSKPKGKGNAVQLTLF